MDSIETPDGCHPCLPGGAALYAALGARSAGAETSICAAVGEDYPEAWVQALGRCGIGSSGIERRPGPTRKACLVHTASGARRSRHDAAWWERTAALTPPAPSWNGVGICVACPMPAASLHRLVKQAGVPVVADTGVFAEQEAGALLALVPCLHVFAPSREETRLLLPGLDDDAAALALARFGPHVLQKRGTEGAVAVAAGTRVLVRIAAPVVPRVCDPTGAGDATVGALAALMLKRSFLEAAELALAAGARAVTATGPAAFGFDVAPPRRQLA